MSLDPTAAIEADEPMADEAVESTENEVHDSADDSPAETNEAADDTSGGGDGTDVASGADEELVQLATMYGLDAGDPKTLAKRMAVYFDRELAQLARQSQQPKQEQAPTKAEAAAAKVAALELAKLLPPELPEGEYDDAIRNRDKQYQAAFNALHEHYGKRFDSLADELTKPLASRLEAMEQFHMQQEASRINNEFDAFFGSQGAEWTGEFGKGPMGNLSPHSPQAKARNAVVELAYDLMSSAAQRGQNLSPKDAANRARASLYADKVTTTARKQVANQLAANKNRALGTPRRKMQKPLDPEARAFEVLQAKLREHGFNNATAVGDDDE